MSLRRPGRAQLARPLRLQSRACAQHGRRARLALPSCIGTSVAPNQRMRQRSVQIESNRFGNAADVFSRARRPVPSTLVTHSSLASSHTYQTRPMRSLDKNKSLKVNQLTPEPPAAGPSCQLGVTEMHDLTATPKPMGGELL